MNPRIVEHGTLYTKRFGDLRVTYLSGKDAPAEAPVFDMSVGQVVLENVGERALNLQYNADQTHFRGHRFTFGPHARAHMEPPESPTSAAEDFIDYDLAPGRKLMISRRDLLDLVRAVGPAALEDGTICTRYLVALLIDHEPVDIEFGPHCFRVAPERDWEEELRRFVKFYGERDAAALAAAG